MHRAHALYRAIEVVKRPFGNCRRQFRSNSVASVTFVHHDGPGRLFHRLDQRVLIEWPCSSRIHYFCAHSSFLEQRSSFQRKLHHAARSDERDVSPRAFDIRHAKRNRIFLRRHRPLQLVAHFIFEENDGIVVSNRGLE